MLEYSMLSRWTGYKTRYYDPEGYELRVLMMALDHSFPYWRAMVLSAFDQNISEPSKHFFMQLEQQKLTYAKKQKSAAHRRCRWEQKARKKSLNRLQKRDSSLHYITSGEAVLTNIVTVQASTRRQKRTPSLPRKKPSVPQESQRQSHIDNPTPSSEKWQKKPTTSNFDFLQYVDDHEENAA